MHTEYQYAYMKNLTNGMPTGLQVACQKFLVEKQKFCARVQKLCYFPDFLVFFGV